MNRGLIVIALGAALTGCVLAPIDLANRRCPCIEGWTCDVARDVCVPSLSDGGVPGAEVCNGADDDGDARVDEGSALCPAPPNATASCVAGACRTDCAPEFADCDDDLENGCEASLGSPATCGGCDVACVAPNDLCAQAGTRYECVADCAEGTTLCGASCVDTGSSASHCGGCNRGCELREGISTSCTEGVCHYACLPGRADCDDDVTTCERDVTTPTACGGCDIVCSTVHATPTCGQSGCTISACEAGWDDCNDDPSDGCEADLASVDHCGGCRQLCAFPFAAASCATGTCAIGSCMPKHADCDGDDANGCEADLTSVASCGGCGIVCEADETCDAGVGCVRPHDVVEIAAGDAFSCARIADGRVFCWGADSSGQLGNGSAGSSTRASAVIGVVDAIDIDVGGSHACAVRTSGEVLCWGENGARQLGSNGPPLDQSYPVSVRSLSTAVQVAAGASHTCARLGSGEVVCWGATSQGQRGTGSTGSDSSTPERVSELSGAVTIEAGRDHTCALRTDGLVSCWGDNSRGQLGDGSITDRARPVTVAGLEGAWQLAAGQLFTCALGSEGAVCWGMNAQGQLGDGTTSDRATPALVPNVLDATALAAGSGHACARLDTGAVSCWGANGSGQIGDGSMSPIKSPTLSQMTGAIVVGAGADHSCAVRGDGSAACWGAGGSGRLGNGGALDSPVPVAILGLP